MSFWTAMVIIVAIAAFANLRMAKYRHLGRGRPDQSAPRLPDATARESELQREVEELRERVKVLERIATEDRHTRAIAAEIESLRDQ